MPFSIKQTPETLCVTCENGTVAHSHSGSVTIRCGAFRTGPQPPQPVSSCSGYEFKYDSPTYAMEKAAWIVEVNKASKFIGFKQPSRLRSRDDD